MRILSNLIPALQKVCDVLADATGIRIVPDLLVHTRNEMEVTLAVPGYCQTQSYTCGFSAGLTVLHTFQPQLSAEHFFRLVAPDEQTGTSTTRLVKALRKCRVGVSWRRNLDWTRIRGLIDKGYPIITTVTTGDPTVHHWVVVYGYGLSPNRVFIAGNGLPLFARKKYPWSEFRKNMWGEKGFGLACWGQ